MSAIPKHCPYQAGDRITRHGWPNDVPRERGYTGTVKGYMGGTILWGTTDDGREWFDEWGRLWPEQHDLLDATDHFRCVCHRHLRPGQLDLFAEAS